MINLPFKMFLVNISHEKEPHKRKKKQKNTDAQVSALHLEDEK